jgi:hypothetical protein
VLRVGITLAVLAIALAVLGIASFLAPICGVWAVTDRASMTVHFYEGRARVFWITSEHEPIVVRHETERGPFLSVFRGPADMADEGIHPTFRLARLFGVRIASRDAVNAFGVQWRQERAGQGYPVSGLELSFVRLPVWLPVVLLLLHPIRAILFGPWLWRRRQRRNLCLTCGYERTGLPEPRCPECGTPHQRACPACGYDLAGNVPGSCPECGPVSA